jgi:hypothetical protein
MGACCKPKGSFEVFGDLFIYLFIPLLGTKEDSIHCGQGTQPRA